MHPLENSPNNINIAIKVILGFSLLGFGEIRVEVADRDLLFFQVVGFLHSCKNKDEDSFQAVCSPV